MILDKNLFEYINNFHIGNVLDNIDKIIQRCIELKRDVVEADEFEKNERMLLNFGHTLGHAVEKLSNYQLPHGSAVALGMCLITKKYAQHLTKPLEECIIKYDLPTNFSCFLGNSALNEADFSLEKLLDVVKLDKKRSGEFLNYIVCTEIGKSEIRKEKLTEFFK
jgi:3-dehydroquinate synthase